MQRRSGLSSFISWLTATGYKVHFEVNNVCELAGVPQNRKRFTLIANRVTDINIIPIKQKGEVKKVKDVIGEHNGFRE